MKDRIIQIVMAVALTCLLLAVFFMTTGCNTAGKAIDSASQKSLVGSGFMTINKITVTDASTNTYTPQIFSMFLNGKYVSVLRNAKFLFYDRQTSASVFNASATTTEENLIIQVNDKESMASVIAQLTKLTEECNKQANSSGISNSSSAENVTETTAKVTENVTDEVKK